MTTKQTPQDANEATIGAVASTAGLCLCDDEVRIVREHGRPYGIRDRTGFLFFFRTIMKYQGQDERYRRELEQQEDLAAFLLDALQRHNGPHEGADAALSRTLPLDAVVRGL